MPRRRDDTLERLRALRTAGDEPAGRAALAEALKGAAPLAEAAAKRITELALPGLDEALWEALDRLLAGPAKKDPGCRAKAAVVEALVAVQHLRLAPFLRAVRHEQWEGGPIPRDSATGLRTLAAHGLVALRYPPTPRILGDLLVGPETAGRTGAIRALVAWGDPIVGSALLRVRLESGERDRDVIAEGLEALMALDPGEDGNLPWVVERLLGEHRDTAESAAIALGVSRAEGALAPLVRFTRAQVRAADRRVGLVAIGLLRSEPALEALLEWLVQGSEQDARSAVEALAPHLVDPRIAQRVRAAAEAAGRGELL